MMHVALIATDKPDALEVRLANRAAHLDYVAATGKVFIAGPLLGDDDQPRGSLIILQVEDMAEAEAWAAADPYARAGLFAAADLRPWKKVVG